MQSESVEMQIKVNEEDFTTFKSAPHSWLVACLRTSESENLSFERSCDSSDPFFPKPLVPLQQLCVQGDSKWPQLF